MSEVYTSAVLACERDDQQLKGVELLWEMRREHIVTCLCDGTMGVKRREKSVLFWNAFSEGELVTSTVGRLFVYPEIHRQVTDGTVEQWEKWKQDVLEVMVGHG